MRVVWVTQRSRRSPAEMRTRWQRGVVGGPVRGAVLPALRGAALGDAAAHPAHAARRVRGRRRRGHPAGLARPAGGVRGRARAMQRRRSRTWSRRRSWRRATACPRRSPPGAGASARRSTSARHRRLRISLEETPATGRSNPLESATLGGGVARLSRSAARFGDASNPERWRAVPMIHDRGGADAGASALASWKRGIPRTHR